MHFPARSVSGYMAGQIFFCLEKSGMAEMADGAYGTCVVESASIWSTQLDMRMDVCL